MNSLANSLKHSEPENLLEKTQENLNISLMKEKVREETKGLTAQKMDHFGCLMERTAEIWSQRFSEVPQSKKTQILTNSTLPPNDLMAMNEGSKDILSRPGNMQDSRDLQQVHFKRELSLFNPLSFDGDLKSEDFFDLLLQQHSNKINKKFEWGSLEDEKLSKLAIELKYDWKEVSKQISSQEDITVEFLENRYKELNKGVAISTKSKFTEEEDEKILYYLKIYGSRWKMIAKNLPGRNYIAVKDHFYSTLRGRVKILNSKRKVKKRRTPKKISAESHFGQNEEGIQGEEAYLVEKKSENKIEYKDLDFDYATFFDFGDDTYIVGENESKRSEKNKEDALFMSPSFKASKSAVYDFAGSKPERNYLASNLVNLQTLGYSPIFNDLFDSNFFPPQDPEYIEEIKVEGEGYIKNPKIEERGEIQVERETGSGSEDARRKLEEMNKKMESLSSLYRKIQKELEKLHQVYKKEQK